MSECRRCGNCCVGPYFVMYATSEDIERRLQQGRYDILQYLNGNPWKWPKASYEMGIPYTLEIEIDIQNNLGNYSFEKQVKKKFRQIATEGGAGIDLWFDPVTGEELSFCPFLRKVRGKEMFECLIYDTRPEICRDFNCQGSFKPFKEVHKRYTRKKALDRYYMKKLYDRKK